MRYAETNKNFRETRCAQTSGNFYWLSVNTAKFLMPRFDVTRTFNMLNLGERLCLNSYFGKFL